MIVQRIFSSAENWREKNFIPCDRTAQKSVKKSFRSSKYSEIIKILFVWAHAKNGLAMRAQKYNRKKKLIRQSRGTFRVVVESGLKSREQEDTCGCRISGCLNSSKIDKKIRLAVHNLRRAQFKIGEQKYEA